MFDLNNITTKMNSSLEAFQRNLSGIRAGRASPSLLDQIKVEVYGSNMPLNQLATVSVQDSTLITVQVWDKGNVGSAEKAIRNSNLNLNPASEGSLIRVPLPKLSEERRAELVKICAEYAEQAKVAIRNIRRDAMDNIKKLQKDSEISEDEQKKYSDDVQQETDQFVKKIDEQLEQKKSEIMAV